MKLIIFIANNFILNFKPTALTNSVKQNDESQENNQNKKSNVFHSTKKAKDGLSNDNKPTKEYSAENNEEFIHRLKKFITVYDSKSDDLNEIPENSERNFKDNNENKTDFINNDKEENKIVNNCNIQNLNDKLNKSEAKIYKKHIGNLFTTNNFNKIETIIEEKEKNKAQINLPAISNKNLLKSVALNLKNLIPKNFQYEKNIGKWHNNNNDNIMTKNNNIIKDNKKGSNKNLTFLNNMTIINNLNNNSKTLYTNNLTTTLNISQNLNIISDYNTTSSLYLQTTENSKYQNLNSLYLTNGGSLTEKAFKSKRKFIFNNMNPNKNLSNEKYLNTLSTELSRVNVNNINVNLSNNINKFSIQNNPAANLSHLFFEEISNINSSTKYTKSIINDESSMSYLNNNNNNNNKSGVSNDLLNQKNFETLPYISKVNNNNKDIVIRNFYGKQKSSIFDEYTHFLNSFGVNKNLAKKTKNILKTEKITIDSLSLDKK